ncbi:unnamed protein product [Cladocopium goreaui]|uniref:Uncharacterized protein n=1 Tax=Cladocopium goreaui TaxID=2562237 RepID=A0A9P1D492_9DINO|nr:unnamed protein product [Cladocopium goreaui]
MFNDRAIFTWIRIATSDLGAKAVLSGTVASSNKRVYVWDVAAEKVLAAVNAHARPLTCLRLAQPHAAAPAASMDIFYSAALDGQVKLWDLRSMQEMGPGRARIFIPLI